MSEEKKCNKCATIPYAVYESSLNRVQNIIKQLVLTIIILSVFLVGTNILWVLYESQFYTVIETYECEVEQESTEDGTNICSIKCGEFNGKTESESEIYTQITQKKE